MNIAGYWNQPAADQGQMRHTLHLLTLQREAEAHHLLLLDGRLITPEAYPCTCDLQEPGHCFADRSAERETTLTAQERTTRTCHCPCHTYA